MEVVPVSTEREELVDRAEGAEELDDLDEDEPP